MVDGAVQRDLQRLELERLGDEVVGPGPDCANGRIEAAERSDQDDRDVRILGDHPRAEIEAAFTAQVDVRNHDLEVPGCEAAHCLFPRPAARDLEAKLPQAGFQRPAEFRFVVDDQDASAHGPSSLGRQIRKMLPRPGSLSTSIHPPCSWTMP